MAGEKAGDPVEYQFAAYVDENKVIHLLLDSVDLQPRQGNTCRAEGYLFLPQVWS